MSGEIEHDIKRDDELAAASDQEQPLQIPSPPDTSSSGPDQAYIPEPHHYVAEGRPPFDTSTGAPRADMTATSASDLGPDYSHPVAGNTEHLLEDDISLEEGLELDRQLQYLIDEVRLAVIPDWTKLIQKIKNDEEKGP